MHEQPTDSLLAPYRALDLTDEQGFLFSKIMPELVAHDGEPRTQNL